MINFKYQLQGGMKTSVWNMQGYFEYIIKIHQEVTDNPSIKV